MDDTDVAARLLAARDRLTGLRPRVEAGAPWPLSDDYGVEPESTWGPPELLAHVAEMLPYWQAQIDLILAGGPGPVPFGRTPTDEGRLGAIGRDRAQTIGELFGRIDEGTDRLVERLRSYAPEEHARVGQHPVRGEMTVDAILEAMLASHIEGHVTQLEGILDSSA